MTTEEAAALAARFDHHDPGQANAMHDVYEKLRADGCPVMRSETNGGFWIAIGHDIVERIIHDPDTFSSRSVTVPASLFADFGFEVLPPVTLDGIAHRDFKRIVLPAFSPKTIERWEDATREACREFIDEFIASGRCDAADDYARRIPVRVMALMVGVSPADEPKFTQWIHKITELGGSNMDDALQAGGEMWMYFMQQIDDHKETKRDDLLDILINAEYEGDKLDDAELLGFLFLTITAGMDTTWSVIGDILCHLARNPEHRRYLAADPSRIPLAIEELVRYYSPALLGRIATKDVELCGQQVKEGESVLLCYPSANRDGTEEIVLDRFPNRHMGFGAGIHRCLGSNLARMELRVSLEEWLARIPEFEIEDESKLRWSSGPVRGPRVLPIVFPV